MAAETITETQAARQQFLTLQKIVAFACEQNCWFKKTTLLSAVAEYPEIDFEVDNLIRALKENYPASQFAEAMSQAEEEADQVEIGLSQTSCIIRNVSISAKGAFLEAMSDEPARSEDDSGATIEAGARAALEIAKTVLRAVAWEKANQEQGSQKSNPFLTLVRLYTLGIAKVWSCHCLGIEEVLTSRPISEQNAQLMSRVHKSQRPCRYQDWREIYPNPEDQEMLKAIHRFAKELS